MSPAIVSFVMDFLQILNKLLSTCIPNRNLVSMNSKVIKSIWIIILDNDEIYKVLHRDR